MNRLHKYLDNITRTLFYYDFQPLLFFWVLSDVFNNMVLWSTHSMWVEQGQGNTYFLYLAYLILYLCLNLFSTIRYLVNIFSQEVIVFEVIDYKNLFITLWYSTMWFWIAFKLKRECFFNTLNENCPK
jgi:hypothetical protein